MGHYAVVCLCNVCGRMRPDAALGYCSMCETEVPLVCFIFDPVLHCGQKSGVHNRTETQ